MGYVSKGKKAMIFVDGKAIALATNHKISLTANVLEEYTKDDGDAPVGEADGYEWGMTSDSIVGDNDSVTNEQTVITLLDTMLAMEEVDVVSDAAAPTSGSVPATGWTEAGDAQQFFAMSGKAYIESLSISAGATGFATSSVSLKGNGELS